MKILVMGAAGMVGRKLIERLLSDGELRGSAISAIHGFDVVEGTFNDTGSIDVTLSAGDISDAATVDALVAEQPDIIFHLAAIVFQGVIFIRLS